MALTLQATNNFETLRRIIVSPGRIKIAQEMHMDGIRTTFGWTNSWLFAFKNDHSSIFLAYPHVTGTEGRMFMYAGDKTTDYPFKTFSPFASIEWRCLDENHLLWLFLRICRLFLSSSCERNNEGRVSFENECARDCALFFFFFWLEGLFLTGTLGDYLMEVKHAGMSGIGESHGGWHRTRKEMRGMERRATDRWTGRRRRGSRDDRRSWIAVGQVSFGNVAIPRGTIKYLTVFSGFIVWPASCTGM